MILNGQVPDSTDVEVSKNNKNHFSIKIGGGLDFFVFPHANLAISVILYQKNNVKISLDNMIGKNVPILFDRDYYYPSITLHRQTNYKWINWINISYGVELYQEYNHFSPDPPTESSGLLHRIDFGFEIFEYKNMSIDIDIPIKVIITDASTPIVPGLNIAAGFNF